MSEFKRRERFSSGARRYDEGSSRNYGDRGRSDDRGYDRGYDRPRAQSFEVVCEKCHKETTVPFRPTNGKPVLCRDCFRGGSDDSSFAPQSNFEPRRESQAKPGLTPADLDQIHAKLDKIIKALNIE